jgi:hypothetical protein
MASITASHSLDAMPKEMSFTYFDAATILFSIGSFLFDIGTDVVVVAFHYINNDFWYELDSKKTFDLKLITFDEQVLRFDSGFRIIAISCNDRHFHEMVCSRLSRTFALYIKMSMDYEIYILIITIGTNFEIL